MRLTNNTLLRGYNRDLNRLKNAKNDCEKKITSTRKFSRASEAPLSAAKALNVRKSQYYDEQYKENLKVAAKFYTEAETSLLQVSEKMAEIRETIIAACNTTKDTVEYKIYAQQLETRAMELCAIFNTDSAGRSIFGGESDDPMPFEIINDSNGNASTVLYHGVPVNSLRDYTGFPYSNKVNMDIGLGMVTDQTEHTQDPLSVLDISFNGAEITGCGADSSVADIDLSSIKLGRQYVFDIYCDGVRKTIDFKGQGSMQDNVDLINGLFDEAFKKDVAAYGRNHPVMDESGIVYSVDVDGNPVSGGLVSIVNNTVSPKSERAELLVIDNDSGYTDKFRLNASALMEDVVYRLDVKVGNEKKTIEFMSGNDNGALFKEDVTYQNFQAALDDAFGEGVVKVSTHDPVKGIVSSEGNKVELIMSAASDPTANPDAKVVISEGAGISKLNLNVMRFSGDDEKREFKFNAGADAITVEIARDSSGDEILAKVNEELGKKGLKVDNDGIVRSTADDSVAAIASADPAALAGTMKNYKIDTAQLVGGQKYNIKVIEGNIIRDIEFTPTADGDVTELQNKLNEAFNNTVTIAADGTLNSTKTSAVLVTNNLAADDKLVVEREKVFSQNYIQLTLDAARALRNDDIEYANACIDRIVTANEHLLLEIADLGCNEDFIDFNIDRITTREYNLAERQNDLEAADPEYQITLWKQYEAYYNACLQMSASVIPNSIFNYMK